MVEKKILFVDDEESQRDVIKRVLTKLGYQVEVAESSEKALEIFQKMRYPLIITDLRMPGMDGTQFCRKIKDINPDAVIIALSAYISSQFRTDNLEEAGFDGWLAKPVTTKRLDYLVRGAFDKITHAAA